MGYLVYAYYNISPTRYYKDDSCWSVDLKSKTTEDIINIGSFMEVPVLNQYVLVRKILAFQPAGRAIQPRDWMISLGRRASSRLAEVLAGRLGQFWGQAVRLRYLKDSGFELTTFLDADHAGCLETRKITSGGIQFLDDKLVSWMSKKQDCTSMSTAEADDDGNPSSVNIKQHCVKMVVLYPNENEIKARRHSKCNPGIRRKRKIKDFIESRQEDYQGPSIKRLELGSRETLHIEKQKETSLINKGGVRIIKVVHGRSGSSISKQKSLNYENDIGDSDVDDSENNDDEFTPYLSGRFIASKQRRHTDSTKNNSIENKGKYENRAYILSGCKDAYKRSTDNLTGVDRTGSPKIKRGIYNNFFEERKLMSFVKSNRSRSSSTSNDTKPKTRQRDSGETSSANSNYISSSPNKTKDRKIRKESVKCNQCKIHDRNLIVPCTK
nr:concanavalin A-like lectin/glucanase, subgroup [Tanacetum cinerariifolium]